MSLGKIYIAGTSVSKLSANENFASAPSYHQNISKERHLDYNYMEDGQSNSYYYDRKYESKLNSHADDVGNGKFFPNQNPDDILKEITNAYCLWRHTTGE